MMTDIITKPVPDSSYEVARRNLEDLDKLENQTSGTFQNRAGKVITPIPVVNDRLEALTSSLESLEQEFVAGIASTGYFPVAGSFETGGTITARNQYLQLITTVGSDLAGGYTWGGAIPEGGLVIPAGSTPSSTGGQSVNAWVWRSDATVRADLANGTAQIGSVTAGEVANAVPSVAKMYEAIPLGLYNYAKSARKKMLFIGDSLTAGAGGTSPLDFVRNTVRAALGDGGYGYGSISNGLPQYFKSGMSALPTAPENSYSQYSPDFGGTFTDAFVSGNVCTFGFSSNWDTIDLYYLKQSGGATFRVDHSDKTTASRYTVDTNSATTELGVLTVEKEAGYGQELAVKWVADGKLLLIGAIARVNNSESILSMTAEGGRRAQQFAELNDSFMRDFYAAIAPDVTFINLGMNDRLTRTSAQIISDVQTIISRLPSTSSVVLVACNESSDYETSSLPQYHDALRALADAEGYGFIDNRRSIGGYADALAKGLMLDGVHPNEAGNALIAAGYLSYLGLQYYSNQTDRAAYISGGSALDAFNFSGELTTKESLSVTDGGSLLIYKIGLIKNFVQGLFTITIYSSSNNAVLKTRHEILIRNATTTNNQVTEILKSVSTELFRRDRPSGPTVVLSHTVSAVIVDNLAEISCTFAGGDQKAVVKASYEFAELPLTGPSVYENSVL